MRKGAVSSARADPTPGPRAGDSPELALDLDPARAAQEGPGLVPLLHSRQAGAEHLEPQVQDLLAGDRRGGVGASPRRGGQPASAQRPSSAPPHGEALGPTVPTAPVLSSLCLRLGHHLLPPGALALLVSPGGKPDGRVRSWSPGGCPLRSVANAESRLTLARVWASQMPKLPSSRRPLASWLWWPHSW